MSHYLRVAAMSAVLLAVSACARPPQPNSAPNRALTVAAAADLQFAFADVGKLFESQTGQTVTLTFGSTGTLAKQIENGAPIDLFAAANVSYVDGLREKGLIIPETQRLYGRGHIVLASNKIAGIQVKALADLLDPKIKHVAIANPNHAPYGLAAKQALVSAGIWDLIQPKLVLGENIRQTLQFIQTGNAEAGIVALSIADVPEIIHSPIDEQLHQPLNQALGVVTGSAREQAAREFAAHVLSPQGQAIMQKYGFQPPAP